MSRTLPGLACLAAATLSACASVKLSSPDTRIPTAYESPPGAATPGLAPATLDRWWLLFGDAQLSGLIEEALAHAPDARTALGRLQEARANRAEALTPFLPQGNIKASATEENTITKTSGFTFGGTSGTTTGTTTGTSGATTGSTVGGFFTPGGETQAYAASFPVSWELDLFGDIRVARRYADADLAASRFDYEATRMSLAAQVATDLFQARGTAVQLADARDNARIAHQLANTGALRVHAGLAATSETARLDSDARTADADVARLDGQLKVQQRRLLALIGRHAASLDSLPVSATIAPAPGVPATAPGDLLTRRPDVRRAQAQLASAAARAELDRLQLFPNLTLQPGLSTSRTAGTYRSFSSVWSIGLGLAIPILDRPKLLAELHAQTARGEQAVASYEQAVQNAYADAETALTTLQADEARTGDLRQAEARARFAFNAASLGYKLGLSDITTLLQAEQTWRATRAGYTGQQTTTLQDAVQTFKALGGGWNAEAAAPKLAANNVRK